MNDLSDLDKLRVLLPHWIEHNSGHSSEFAKWTELMRVAGRPEIANLLATAAARLQDAEAALRDALRSSGGALDNQKGRHHHHHNLPE